MRIKLSKKLKSFVFALCFGAIHTPAFAWDTPPKSVILGSKWESEKFIFATSSPILIDYTNDGTSQLRYSLTPPVEGSTAGTVFGEGWNTLDGKVVFRGKNENIGGNEFRLNYVSIGGVTRGDKNGMHSGVFYVWYGQQAMTTVNWTMYYVPFPVITSPSGVIDLGTCHKSVGGEILSNSVNSAINIYGYLNGETYIASRTLTFANLPAGASFTESNGTLITAGETKSLQNSISEPPLVINDTFIAKLNCDQATVGVQTWTAKVTYTIE